MYIQSKLREGGDVLFDLHLGEWDEMQQQEPSLYEQKVVGKGGDGVDVESVQLFTLGLGIIASCFRANGPITDLIKIKGEHVQFLFFFQGKSQIVNASFESPLAIDEGSMHMSYQKDVQFSVEMCPENEVRYLAIIMSKGYFMHLLGNEPWSRKDSFFANVTTNFFVELGAEALLITFHIRKILQDITQNVHQGENKKHYIELKLKELFFEVYAQQSKVPLSLVAQEPGLYEKVNEAQAILTNNFVSPPTIRQLARMVALNELKLKQGFKAVCGSTIHVFIINLRMKEAYDLLQEENAVVNEVSVKIGYRSVSHFISTFKNYYGFTPKQLTKNALVAKPAF